MYKNELEQLNSWPQVDSMIENLIFCKYVYKKEYFDATLMNDIDELDQLKIYLGPSQVKCRLLISSIF